MNSLIKISEAASIALHTMVLLAGRGSDSYSSRELAGFLGVSEFHLAKVMQSLGRAGLVSSRRGPGGGFRLACDPQRTSLLNVYQAIEGVMDPVGCLLPEAICTESCILGGLLNDLDNQIREYFSKTMLSDLNGSFDCEVSNACG